MFVGALAVGCCVSVLAVSLFFCVAFWAAGPALFAHEEAWANKQRPPPLPL